MATVDTVKTALVNKLETSITNATPEQLAYIAKAVNSIEPPIAWESKDSSFTAENYSGYFINTTDGEVIITMPNVSGNTVGDGRVNIVDVKQNFQTNHVVLRQNGTDKILGQDSDIIVDTMGTALQMVWSGGTDGWQFMVQG
tara:strand:+ start:2413 stop:2838 length:426 start_codon:yes stop_codon:yes gene_type:complete